MIPTKLKTLKNGARLIGLERLSDIVIMWMSPDYTPALKWGTLCVACMFFTTITTIMVGGLMKMNMSPKMITMASLLTLITHVGMVMATTLKSYMWFTAQMVSEDFSQKTKYPKRIDIWFTKNTKKALDELGCR